MTSVALVGSPLPTLPTSKNSTFGLIGQLLTPTPPPAPQPPRVGLESLSITFGTNPDKSHMGQQRGHCGLWAKPHSPLSRAIYSLMHLFITSHLQLYVNFLVVNLKIKKSAGIYLKDFGW